VKGGEARINQEAREWPPVILDGCQMSGSRKPKKIPSLSTQKRGSDGYGNKPAHTIRKGEVRKL